MTAAADSTGPLIREIARLYVRAQRVQVACCDGASNAQCQVLIELLRNEGLTQQALVERLQLDKGWISRAVDALVEDGAVAKQQSEVDRRSVKLSLTGQGRERGEKLERQLNSHAAQLLEDIPSERQAQIQEALQLLLQALQGHGKKPIQGDACGAPNKTALVIRPASEGDWPAIEDLLLKSELPLDGAREHLDNFVVGTLDGQIACAGGLEIYGSDALLRSVVVAQRLRGQGHGAALVATLTRIAREGGVSRLFLLTTTAASYFSAVGFVPTTRDDVPESVRQSREFQDACPASATVMTLQVATP